MKNRSKHMKALKRALSILFLLPILPIIGVPGDGGGDGGDGGDGGKGGSGAGGENKVTFSPEQLTEINRIADERSERARTAALKSYFEQQGLDEASAKAAMDAYKAEQAKKKTPEQIEAEAQTKVDNALKSANSRLIDAECRVQAVALGVVADNIPGVIKLAEGLDKVKVNDDGTVDAEAVKTALNDVLTKYPAMKGAADPQSLGGGSNPPPAGDKNPGSFGASLAKGGKSEDQQKREQDALNKLYGNN